MLFVLLLTVYTEDSMMVYVQGDAMAGASCTSAIEAYTIAAPRWSQGTPSCEPDHATLPAVIDHRGFEVVLPACPMEDSANCYWDATERGNGLGNSFYDVNGETFYFLP